MKKIRTYTVPYTQKANVIERCDCGLDFYIPQGEPGTAGSVDTIEVGKTTTLPAGSAATVTNSGTDTKIVLDFGIPQGEQGASGSGGVPLNFFDGWMATYSPTVANQPIIFKTTITHETNNGIAYNDATGVLTTSIGWWKVQYGFTVVSATNVTLNTFITQGGTGLGVSTILQPLIANQPQTLSRTFVIPANGNLQMTFVSATTAVTFSQLNWFVQMLED